jgi:CubicO group peptidase (beta-lactamase class C family)
MRHALIALAAALALSAAAPPRPVMDPAEAERIYSERFAAAIAGGRGELPRYDPVEAVPGAARPGALRTAAPEVARVRSEAVAQARAYAAANNSSAFLVWRGGRLIEESYFGGATADTPIVSKSLAKPLTALVVGRALKLGKIRSLDQSVADFIPEWRGKPQAAITVRHLLDMRTGLLAQNFSLEPDNIWSRAYLHPVHERIMVEDYPLTDPPGSIYEYSNVTSELVALVIEAATGRRYAEFVSTEVLKPVGAAGGEVWINRPGGLAHSGCCILLPAHTWLKLAILVEQEGVWDGRRLLPDGFVREMSKGTAQNPWYGMGLWVAGPFTERRGFANPSRPGPKVLHSEPFLAADLVMFDGNSNQVAWIVPSEDLVILRVGDQPPRTPEWDNTAIPNTILRGIVRKPSEAAPTPQARPAG